MRPKISDDFQDIVAIGNASEKEVLLCFIFVIDQRLRNGDRDARLDRVRRVHSFDMGNKTKRDDERQRVGKRRFETNKVLEDEKPARFSPISLKRTVQDAVGLSIEYFGGGEAKEKSNFVGSLALIEAALEALGLGFDLSAAVEIGALRVAVH